MAYYVTPNSMDNLSLGRGEWDVFDGGTIESQLQMYKNAASVIDEVLKNEGATEIKKNITRLLPSSGRHWKGKGSSAIQVMPGKFEQRDSMLEVTIAAVGKYHYLYFPDDGTNTKKHAGEQHFMRRGAENTYNKIFYLCLRKLDPELV